MVVANAEYKRSTAMYYVTFSWLTYMLTYMLT